MKFRVGDRVKVSPAVNIGGGQVGRVRRSSFFGPAASEKSRYYMVGVRTKYRPLELLWYRSDMLELIERRK